MEFFLLVAGLAVTVVLCTPWALAHSRRSAAGGRWPRKVVTTHSAEPLGDGAYRRGDVEVERVVAVEEGPPEEVATAGRAAFATASLMFVGGVLAGAWVPVWLWLAQGYWTDLAAAYLAGLAVAGGWVFAAFTQFRAAWERWEPRFDAASEASRDAWRATALAAALSLLAFALARGVYGPKVSMVPVWFSLFAAARAWTSRRSLAASEALYRRAEDNERARAAKRELTGVRVTVAPARVVLDEDERGIGAVVTGVHSAR